MNHHKSSDSLKESDVIKESLNPILPIEGVVKRIIKLILYKCSVEGEPISLHYEIVL
jgi:hypothetical protein